MSVAGTSTPGVENAVLTFPDGRTVKLPYLTDSAGNKFVDIGKLYGETGAERVRVRNKETGKHRGDYLCRNACRGGQATT